MQEYAGLGGDANFVKAEGESQISRPIGAGCTLARRALIPARWETELAARPIPAWWADEREDVQNERSRTERPK